MRWEGSHRSRPSPGRRLKSKRFSVTPRAPTLPGEEPPRSDRLCVQLGGLAARRAVTLQCEPCRGRQQGIFSRGK